MWYTLCCAPPPWRGRTMPLDAAQKRAIARLSVATGAGQSRGTGFLVGGDRLLTAFHVVGDRKTGKAFQGTLEVAFGDPREGKSTMATARLLPDRFSAEGDWALLACDAVPPGVAPFELARLEQGYDLSWETYGFSDAAPDRGQVYGGVVRSLGATIQLYGLEAAAGESSRVKGLSGSPCLVHGRAVGILLSANVKEEAPGVKAAREGTLFARSIAEIARRCPELTLRAEKPPFTPHVAQFLQPATPQLLPVLIQSLGLPTSALPPDQLSREIAQRLLEVGVKDACAALAEVVAGVPKLDANRILELVAACSVHQDAAERLRQAFLMKVDEQAVCVNAARPDTGKRYILRAGENYPGWKRYLRTVSNVGSEAQPAALISEVRELLADALKCSDKELEEELAARGHDAPPLVVVVPPPLPAPTGTAALRGAFPTVRFVFLAGETVADTFAAEYPKVMIVEPLLAPGHEAEQEKAFSRALKSLEEAYRAL
jgi:hypothetical protein